MHGGGLRRIDLNQLAAIICRSFGLSVKCHRFERLHNDESNTYNVERGGGEIDRADVAFYVADQFLMRAVVIHRGDNC